MPGKATLWIGNATYKPGSSTAYVPVYLDRATPNTVIARITTVNGTGTLKATSGTNYKTVDTVVIFRPGDPLEQTVEVPVISASEGQQFSVKLREAPWGALQGQSTATVTAKAYVAATEKATGTFREARTFAATGTLQFELLKDTHKRSAMAAGTAGPPPCRMAGRRPAMARPAYMSTPPPIRGSKGRSTGATRAWCCTARCSRRRSAIRA